MTSQAVALPPVPPVTDIQAGKSRKMEYYESSPVKKLFYSERETSRLNNNPTTRKIMAPYGYDSEKIAGFTAAHQAAAQAQVLQTKEASEKVGAYASFEKQFSVAKGQIYYLAKVAKIAFRNNEHVLDILHISRKKGRTISQILDYMDNFYQQVFADQEIIKVLTKYNYPESTLTQFQDEYRKSRFAYNELNKESGDAVQATRVRDKKIAELDDWMYEYYGFLKIAYAQNPNWLAEQQAEEALSHNG